MAPKRPRSHQLEDISRNKFEASLPDTWVVRPKDHDYGIDCEVEIFDENGIATGLMFFVQLRATEKLAEAEKIVLRVSQMDYFISLTLPTIIVRYCHVTESTVWDWHFNVAAVAGVNEGQKTFTHHFQEANRWSENAPAAIKKTLETRLLIQRYTPITPVELRLHRGPIDSESAFNLDQTIYNLTTITGRTLVNFSDDENRLVVDIFASLDSLVISIDCICSVKLLEPDYQQTEIESAICYMLVAVLKRHDLVSHADSIAQRALRLGIPCRSRFLAVEACISLGRDLRKSVVLAILNDIPKLHDDEYLRYINYLIIVPQQEEDRDQAVFAFYRAALNFAYSVHNSTAAAVHYSWGNYCRVRSQYFHAVKHFNKARKLREEYTSTGYFLVEFGATMFGMGKYAWAKRLYQTAIIIEKSPRLELCLSDAMFFNGDLAQAKLLYDKVIGAKDRAVTAEAQLKFVLCDWLLDFVENDPPVRRTTEVRGVYLDPSKPPTTDECMRVIKSIDCTDVLAHFNLGITKCRESEHTQAMFHFLLCACKQSGDFEAWANAMISAFNAKEIEFFTLIMACALSLAGSPSYVTFRSEIVQHEKGSEFAKVFDEVYRSIMEDVKSSTNEDVTFRALTDTKYDIAIQT
jgi:tetratricopeptide (TPR) repeat protein